ncbi:spike glycoprotein [Wigeon coronavirus HKU20]|uniref:Spike glycoprotein n=1 Tax=Wigeon coronavirus HKU20 TaxID=1159908 RepID=H9BR25_9NIDO|nr:spike glycoprotein [Wigeon coronavirus HKU20]AFD29234.1 spike glycoprotein [Wigeon coronavirus HKU20]
MYRFAILMLVISPTLAASIADKVLDVVTFPGASRLLYPQHYQQPQVRGWTDDIGVDGRIPATYPLTNTFYLSNTTTPVDGVYTSLQPLLIRCKFKYVNDTVNAGKILTMYFNLTNNTGRCDGNSEKVGLVDAIRFQINVTTDILQLTAGSINFTTPDGELYTLHCLNTTLGVGQDYYPSQSRTRQSGVTYHCYMIYRNTSYAYSANEYTYRVLQYLGPLPASVREIVAFSNGFIYINGILLSRIPALHKVDFGLVKSAHTSDYYVILFADMVDVMVNISATEMQSIFYCITPFEQVKCSQKQTTLSDGFYSTSAIEVLQRQRTFVGLPMAINITTLNFAISYLNTKANPSLGAPQEVNLTINGFADQFCVTTSQFMVTLNVTCLVHNNTSIIPCPQAYTAEISPGDCPFNFLDVNNYLMFDSICFSPSPSGDSCQMVINKVWANNRIPMSSVYVSYVYGNQIVGVPRHDLVQLDHVVFNLCTDYTIYGYTGTGVIRETNTTYFAGYAYASPAGQLVAYKNLTTGAINSITPCKFSQQLAVYNDTPVALVSAVPSQDFGFTNATSMGTFVVNSNATNCTIPALTYGPLGICANGAPYVVPTGEGQEPSVVPISTGNISIPVNFTVAIQPEYLQVYTEQVVVDCATYVCNGNPLCNKLLLQYTSACDTIEQALQMSARLESSEVSNMLHISTQALDLANISNFEGYNMSFVLPAVKQGRSALEDLLFTKVVTAGLGTVDADYEKCAKGMDIADLVCVQYYNGIMVLPGVANAGKMAEYTASLTGGMVMGGITSAASIPFSLAVQSRLNYVALQTGVMLDNQKLLADSFNKAMETISGAFNSLNSAVHETINVVNTLSSALTKIQSVVNQHTTALNQLTQQLANNFQAISSSITDIYNRLGQLEADAQVDRLITGRLAALNAFVSQTLTKAEQVRQSRLLAQQKVNECVKSQSQRFGFCGNGSHIFTIANAAPDGIMFLHTVLQPVSYITVVAYSGLCVDNTYGYALKEPNLALVQYNGYYVTPRNMYQPRPATTADFVQIQSCDVTLYNITYNNISLVIPDFVDTNKTIEDIISSIPNNTAPSLEIASLNLTVLNLTSELEQLKASTGNFTQISQEIQDYINKLNDTLVDLEWLNRVETYVKWPWWVWLLIFLAICTFIIIVVTIFLCTGCCGGCFGCFGGCCGLFSRVKHHEFSHLPVEEQDGSIPITYKKVN